VIRTPRRSGPQEMFVVPEYQPGNPAEVRIDNDFTSEPLPFHPDALQLSREEQELASRMSLHMQLQGAFLADSGSGQESLFPAVDSLPFYGKPEISVRMDDFVNLPNLEEVIENLLPKTFVVRRGGGAQLIIDSENPMISMFPPLILIDHIPVFDMEDMAGQARTLGFFQTMTGDMYNADVYLSRIKQVTADDILRVSRTYLRPENLSIGLMAPEGTKIDLETDAVMSLFKGTPAEGKMRENRLTEGKNAAEMTVLKNGMRVIIKENHRLPEVSVSGAFLGGKRFEKAGEWGISGFVAEMLTRGTQKRTAADIAATVESWAGSLDGFSGNNSLGVSGKFLSKDLYAGLELLSDLILHVDFPSGEIEKVREDILAAIRAKKDRPTAQLFELFFKTLYPHYPYGHPATGTAETISRITRNDLKTWYESIRIPSNFVLAVVGDLDLDQLIPYLETLFEPFQPSSDKALPELKPEPPLTGPRKAHLNRPGAQAHLSVGYLGAGLKSNNNPPMALVDTALSGMGGRLFTKLRDKRSLAYSVTAFRSPGLDTGAFGVYLACDPAKLPEARKAVFGELALLRDKGLTDKELAAAKRYLLGNLKIGMQTNGSQAMQMALDELYGLGYDHRPKYIREIESVTQKDVNRAVKEIILPERYILVTVGPEED